MKKDYTKEIRNCISYMYSTMVKYSSSVYGITNEEQLKRSLLASLNQSEVGLFQRQIDPYSYPAVLGIITMIRNQMFIDSYKSLNLKEKLGTLAHEDKFDLQMFRNNMEPFKRLELSRCIYTTMAVDMLNEILNYKNLSVYEKILQVKALSQDDIKILSENSPFFEEDIKKYDVPIKKEFIIDRINRLNASKFKDDNEKTYEETADFIFKLAKITEPNESVLNSLVMEYPDSILKECTDSEFIFHNVGGKIYKSNLKDVLKEITKKEPNKIKEKNTKE